MVSPADRSSAFIIREMRATIYDPQAVFQRVAAKGSILQQPLLPFRQRHLSARCPYTSMMMGRIMGLRLVFWNSIWDSSSRTLAFIVVQS